MSQRHTLTQRFIEYLPRASILMTLLVSTGLEMADKCVKLFHCGTHATGWLKNGHPALSDGPVLREVCFHWLNDCCYFKQQILVRRCKNFYVYEFPGTGKSFLQLLCYNIKFYDDFVLIVRKVLNLNIVCATGIGRYGREHGVIEQQ